MLQSRKTGSVSLSRCRDDNRRDPRTRGTPPHRRIWYRRLDGARGTRRSSQPCYRARPEHFRRTAWRHRPIMSGSNARLRTSDDILNVPVLAHSGVATRCSEFVPPIPAHRGRRAIWSSVARDRQRALSSSCLAGAAHSVTAPTPGATTPDRAVPLARVVDGRRSRPTEHRTDRVRCPSRCGEDDGRRGTRGSSSGSEGTRNADCSEVVIVPR